ncbi:MAG TPA: methyltransferase domain-containing protein [Stellaceae bacterium]|jgi:SAM-dependent methyltransferase|nr:methyltransferase domain-containing protein [Stellaceae bacterium]
MADEHAFFTDGASYERLMGRWSQLVAVQFLAWLDAPKGLRWLDVGCGNGAFSEVLMRERPPAALCGIDPSEAQLAYARSRRALKAATFQIGDAQALPFDAGHFDAATMALVITFIPDPVKAVSEMKRVTRPGGWVAGYMWDAPAGGLPQQPLFAAARTLGLPAPSAAAGLASVHSEAELRAVWQKAGLEATETRRIDIAVTYDDFDDFWQSATLLASPMTKLVSGLAPAERERLKEHLAATLPRDAAGHVTGGAFANAVRGRVPS